MADFDLHVSRARPRAESDPSEQKGRVPIPRIVPSRLSFTSLLYDAKYLQFHNQNFAAGKTVANSWDLEPPEEIRTTEQARQAFYYTHYRLKQRDITPRAATFLADFNRTLEEFLAQPSDIKKTTEIQTMNRVFHSKVFYYREMPAGFQNWVKAVHELAKLRYYANYGAYVAFCKCISAKAQNVDILIGKSWAQVNDAIKKEKKIEEEVKWQYGPCGEIPHQPMTGTIAIACEFLGLEYENMKYCIDYYAERNKHFHSSAGIHIKNCDWDSLGRQLWRDMQEVPNVFGAADQVKMKQAVEQIRDRFFLRLTATSRIPSEEAMALMKEKRAQEDGRWEHIKKQIEAEENQKKKDAVKKTKSEKEQLERELGVKRKERESKSSSDALELEEDLGLDSTFSQ
ncbi:MAG: hypothetical protein LQ341_005223 [Variospora aurantia]|nr:MAG: hypothetical protein LQ341_005223 [Variospora aurantia]